jgi:phosphopantothenoylcysteine decarboxylase/phosphopantothenate--cysteine ligase
MAKIVVGVCGSVAAVKVPELVREFVRRGVEVECVMSEAARKIISSHVLEWASGKKVVTEISGGVEHVRLCGVDGEAKVLLVCPATSNTISKISCGIDDSPVTTFAATAMGSGISLVIVPAMHVSMYYNPFVIENIKRLKKQGVVFVEPEIDENKAKLPENDVIVERVLEVLG